MALRLGGFFIPSIYTVWKKLNKLKKQEEYYGLYRKGKRSRLKYKRCRDCGKMFLVDRIVKNSKRCSECQEIADKERKRRWWNKTH